MRPSSVEGLKRSIEQWTRDLSSERAAFASLAKEMLESFQADLPVLESLIEQYQAAGLGFTLKHRSMESWGFVLRDATEPGRYRWQEFKAFGFIGHHTHDTPEECVGDMFDSGYITPDPVALDRLSAEPEWHRGMAVTLVIQQMNSRQIAWEEGHRQIENINATYGKLEAA
ncbi:hypothetical protein ACS8E9_17330 [Pseudomonas neustonica]|uniref:hypothetical protein n=1 Tax=Pseudomonas neustonica TaxID=2487346 RepID=UPI003F452E22|tara:strand:- start:12860 stop:13372 length:513 start_codon:yes stop_codon:yes gene_type:complete